MTTRRALWIDDSLVDNCSAPRCRTPFGYFVSKHHCRRCGYIFCESCSSQKLLIPPDQVVARPATWLEKTVPDIVPTTADSYGVPYRVCNQCAVSLQTVQDGLRAQLSSYNQEVRVDFNSTIPSLPALDFRLDVEIGKAALMLHNFRHAYGEEKIPRELLDIACGIVFLTIIKAGFVVTGRYGTGLVISKISSDGKEWSAPSAVTISGLGWGLQVGAEVADVMLILTNQAAVETFKSSAQISVGAELGVSVGPLGRSIGSDVSAGNKGASHAFSYAHSKGLFFGVSLEACGVASRTDVNCAFYGRTVSASALLSGEISRPKAAEPLYKALEETMAVGVAHAQRDGRHNRLDSQVPAAVSAIKGASAATAATAATAAFEGPDEFGFDSPDGSRVDI